MPTRHADDANAVQQAIARAIEEPPETFPHVPPPATSVLTITRDRPSPVPDMFDALNYAQHARTLMVFLPTARPPGASALG